jgi:hypothetical protein
MVDRERAGDDVERRVRQRQVLRDLVQRAQADGSIRPDADPGAAAWLLLSVLSARRVRAAAMPAGLEPAVTALALDALTGRAGRPGDG